MPTKLEHIDALVNLIDDPDELIFDQIKSEILACGPDAIPYLEKAWEKIELGPLYQQRIELLLSEINLSDISEGFVNWKKNQQDNLLLGLVLINKLKYPNISFADIQKKIDRLVADAKIDFEEQLTSFEKIRHINKVLFDVHGFEGNNENYYAPENSFISDVLQTKKGNAISLSMIYMLVANKLGVPLKGVNLPKHFILGYEFNQQNEELSSTLNTSMKFYVNPFSKGAILGEKEIDHFLDEIKITPRRKFYNKCSNLEIIIRILNNLKNSYSLLKNKEKHDFISGLIDTLRK